MKSLFPDMEAEIASDRLAQRREHTQRAREWLGLNRGLERYVLNHLKAEGPSVDANMMVAMMELHTEAGDAVKRAAHVILTAWALWRVGKLWRREFKNHPSGVQCYLYGIKGVHVREAAT